MVDDSAGERPRPPLRPRASGDGWVLDDEGRRYWGLYGAAGLLLFDPEIGVLLQHRALWSHFGGTWGLPGGARHENESPEQAACREAGEEAGVPASAIALRFCSIVDLGVWSYTTVAAAATQRFEPVISDPESLELRWVPLDEVDTLPLHPGFAASWPFLRPHLGQPLTVVIDAANVVGSRPDGWWRDRAGATERLAARLREWARRGVRSPELDLAHDVWFPRVVLVIEGAAKDADLTDDDAFAVVRAPKDGDATIVDVVEQLAEARAITAPPVLVVTADRELSERARAFGATVLTPGWLLDRLDALTGS